MDLSVVTLNMSPVIKCYEMHHQPVAPKRKKPQPSFGASGT